MYARLAAHGAVHLRQQGRRDLYEGDAAQGDARREPPEVADDAPTERDQCRIAVDARVENRVEDMRQTAELLARLARRHHDRIAPHARRLEPGRPRPDMPPGHR